jgi:hypothetical protein
MKEREDYKAWFYIPVSQTPLEHSKEFVEAMNLKGYSENKGGKLD